MKGQKQGCYWFKPGNKIVMQVWDWNANTPDELLGTAMLDLRALSQSRFEVELAREEAAFQARLASKEGKHKRAKGKSTSDAAPTASDAASAGQSGSATAAADADGAAAAGQDGENGGGGRGGEGEAEAGGVDDMATAPHQESASGEQEQPDFEGKIQLEGRQVSF